jgi:hypothetical protein
MSAAPGRPGAALLLAAVPSAVADEVLAPWWVYWGRRAVVNMSACQAGDRVFDARRSRSYVQPRNSFRGFSFPRPMPVPTGYPLPCAQPVGPIVKGDVKSLYWSIQRILSPKMKRTFHRL